SAAPSTASTTSSAPSRSPMGSRRTSASGPPSASTADAMWKAGGGRVDVGIAVSIVPIVVGLVVLGLRFGLPTLYETPLAIALGVSISVGYTVADQVPGGGVIADAVLRGVAIGLTSAGLIAGIRRLLLEDRARR